MSGRAAALVGFNGSEGFFISWGGNQRGGLPIDIGQFIAFGGDVGGDASAGVFTGFISGDRDVFDSPVDQLNIGAFTFDGSLIFEQYTKNIIGSEVGWSPIGSPMGLTVSTEQPATLSIGDWVEYIRGIFN